MELLGRDAARVRMFELVQAMQSGDSDATAQLAELVDVAVGRGWLELVRLGLFGRAVDAWVSSDPRLDADVTELIEISRRDGDECMTALGLAMRAAFVVDGDLGVASPAFDGALAEAVVLLERSPGATLEKISALTVCGIAFAFRGLWELADESYAAALRLEAMVGPGVGQVLLAAVVFNRVEAQVTWAGRLRQLGDKQGLEERLAAWRDVMAASELYDIPPAWRPELDALGLLIQALAGEDVTEEAEREMVKVAPGGADRSVGHLKLAGALSRLAGGREAGSSVQEALGCVDAEMFPLLYEVALFLAAEVEAAAGPGAGLRYARLQGERRWADRLAQLEAMRLRIASERMRSELDRVSVEVRRDDLTGIGNRRALAAYTADLHRSGTQELAILMVDVDAFKPVNDRYGHTVGDAVLSRIASILDDGIRPSDLAIRLGGDEFLVILPGVDTEVARPRAVALMEAVSSYPWSEIGDGLQVSVSMGVSSGSLDEFDSIRESADRAVYESKRCGGGVISAG